MAIDYFEEWVGSEFERDKYQAKTPPRLDLLKSKDECVRADEACRVCVLHYGVQKKATDDLTRTIIENCLFLKLLRNELIFRPLLDVITDAVNNLDYTNYGKQIRLARNALHNFRFIDELPYQLDIKEEIISICSKIIEKELLKFPEVETPKRKDGMPDMRYKTAYEPKLFEMSQKSLKSEAKKIMEIVDKWE
jgi:hypothetical protein